jgi:hypothetical protein
MLEKNHGARVVNQALRLNFINYVRNCVNPDLLDEHSRHRMGIGQSRRDGRFRHAGAVNAVSGGNWVGMQAQLGQKPIIPPRKNAQLWNLGTPVTKRA